MNRRTKNPIFRTTNWLIVLCCLLQLRGYAQCPVYTAPVYDNVSYRDYFTTIGASFSEGSSTIAIGSGTPDATYVNYGTGTSPQGITAAIGSTINLAVARCSTPYTGYVAAYVDWNMDGQFDSTERGSSPALELAPYVPSDIYTFTVPACAVAGHTYAMRLMLSEMMGNHFAPCHSTWGQALDFYLMTTCPASIPITGASAICNGTTTTMACQVGCGTWTSSNPSVATINPSTGVVNGVVGGTTTISYNTPGCGLVSTVLSVNPLPITGNAAVCTSSTTTLSSGPAGGTWSISAGGSVVYAGGTSSTSRGAVSAAATGTYTVTYTAAGCSASIPMLVQNPASLAITGASVLCQGANTTFTTASTISGTWSSSSVIASVNSSGVVHGNSSGTATITFTSSAAGGCYATHTITVEQPVVSGSTSICTGQPVTFTSSTGSSGTWSTSSPSIASVGASTGVVTGNIAGNVTISFTSVNGCVGSKVITVLATPNLDGPTLVCVGTPVTLSYSPAGGTFASSATSIGTVSSTGVVTGVSGGSFTALYTRGGCTASWDMTTGTPPTITGASSLTCGTAITLSGGLGGGTWSSSATGVASVNSSGRVTGVTPGVTTVSYSGGIGYSGGYCYGTKTVTVNQVSMSGADIVCTGSTAGMSVSAAGGTYSSSNVSVATVNSSGVVSGVAVGTATITYAFSGSCFTTHAVTVNQTPTVVVVPSSVVCPGSFVTCGCTLEGGVFSSSDNSIATVIPTAALPGYATGAITGVAGGTVTISYTLNGCVGTVPVTVNPAPSITGPDRLCGGGTNPIYWTYGNYSSSVSGGTWSSSTSSCVDINSSTGVAISHAEGPADGICYSTITYTAPTGCSSTKDVIVDANPAIYDYGNDIYPPTTFPMWGNKPIGGYFQVDNPAIVTVSYTGLGSLSYPYSGAAESAVVTGVSPGDAHVFYFVTYPGHTCYFGIHVTVH